LIGEDVDLDLIEWSIISISDHIVILCFFSNQALAIQSMMLSSVVIIREYL
jgi:hypothetical protein